MSAILEDYKSLSRRMRQLERAADEARSRAAAGFGSGWLSRRARRGSIKVLRAAAGVVTRHPVSAALIASVLVGTAVYHNRQRHEVE
jgi:hypothetical protein